MDGRVRFRERELARAVRGVVKAGLTVKKVDVSGDGHFSLIISHGDQEATPEINDDWDRPANGKAPLRP
jgi:hypothetical protein